MVNEAIKCVEDEEFERAFELFAKALNKIPNSAAILNDRAQALRLVFRDQGKRESSWRCVTMSLCQVQLKWNFIYTLTEALDDLNLAIQLSGGRGKTAVKALCQRALLYRQLGREQEAIQDFEKAAQCGSQFAKSQLVALNPYAALCNAMLQQLFLPTNSS